MGRSPIVTAITYTVIGVLPLYLTAAQSVRLQTELGFTRTQFGLIIGAFYLVAAIASKRIGPVLDRQGPDFGLRYSGMIIFVSAGVAAASTGWVTLAIGMAIGGLGNAFGQISSNLVVAIEVPESRTGRAFAAKQAAVPVGAMLAGLAVPWIGLSTSWRVPFIAAAIIGAASSLITPHFPFSATTTGPQTHRRITRSLGAFMVMAAIGGGIGNSVASFVTDASVAVGFSQVAGARILTAGSAVAIVARLAVGSVADRRHRSGVLELVSLLGVAIVGLGILGTSAGSMNLFVVGVLLTFAGSWGWQGVMFYSVVRLIPMPAATSTGAVAAGAYFGTMIAPPLVGFGADRFSYEAVFTAQAGIVLIAIAAILLSQRWANEDALTGTPTPIHG